MKCFGIFEEQIVYIIEVLRLKQEVTELRLERLPMPYCGQPVSQAKSHGLYPIASHIHLFLI